MRNNGPFGVLAFLHWNHDWNDWHFPPELLPKAMRQLKELGIKSLRLDVVWSDIHRGDDKYDYTHYDKIIKPLTQEGFELLVLLHYNKERLSPSGETLWNHPPASFQEFARYVETTVRRYKDCVKHWEIWNEPNHPYYWVGPADDLRGYCKLLRASYTAAKNADPSCLVLNGGLTEQVAVGVQNLYTHGGKDIFDVLSIHTFVDPLKPTARKEFDAIITEVRKVMERNNDAKKKIWITEMGCPGVPQPKGVKNWWLGENLSEDQQAEWLEQQYAMIKPYPFIEKLFWAFYRDTGEFFRDGTDYFGLVRFDLSPKPAFERMKRLIRQS